MTRSVIGTDLKALQKKADRNYTVLYTARLS